MNDTISDYLSILAPDAACWDNFYWVKQIFFSRRQPFSPEKFYQQKAVVTRGLLIKGKACAESTQSAMKYRQKVFMTKDFSLKSLRVIVPAPARKGWI